MFTIRRHIEIDAGHRVPYHQSGCRFLHGHRYRVTVEVASPELQPPDPTNPASGMVVDFGVLKEALVGIVHDRFDHRLILWEHDPILPTLLPLWGQGIVQVPVIPTAEALAELWGMQFSLGFSLSPFFTLRAVEVRETPTSLARWEPGATWQSGSSSLTG